MTFWYSFGFFSWLSWWITTFHCQCQGNDMPSSCSWVSSLYWSKEIDPNQLYHRQVHSLPNTSIPYSFFSWHRNVFIWFYSITKFCGNNKYFIFKANEPHGDYPPSYSTNSKRVLVTFCFITTLSVLIFYFLGKRNSSFKWLVSWTWRIKLGQSVLTVISGSKQFKMNTSFWRE